MINQISAINFKSNQYPKEQKPKKIKNKGWFPAMFAPVVAGNAVLTSNMILLKKFQAAGALSAQETTTIQDGIQKTLKNLKNKGLDIKIISVAERKEQFNIFKHIENMDFSFKNTSDFKKIFQSIPLVAPENKRAFIEYLKICENSESSYKKFKFNKIVNLYGRLIEKGLDFEKGSISDSPQVKRMVKRWMYVPGFNQLEKGTNAFSFFKIKQIFMPKNKLAFSTFHEIGHILTYQSKAGKLLQKAKMIGGLGFGITILSIFGKKREETPDKKLNPWHKTVNFVRNNAGKLMFASAIPLLADEALASINANKIAKKVLSPELLKKMNKGHMWGFSTYLLQALGATASVYGAVKIKDYFQDKHAENVNAFNKKLQQKQNPPIEQKPQSVLFEKFKM